MDKPVLSPKFLRELAEENPLGITVTPAQVQMWWDIAWLRYKTYGYRKHPRAIRRWWARLTEIELQDAIDRAQSAADHHEVDALEAFAEQYVAAHSMTDYAAGLK